MIFIYLITSTIWCRTHSRVGFQFKCVLTGNPTSQGEVGHTTRVYNPYSFWTVVWVLLHPTRTGLVKVLWDGTYPFLSLSKTRKSNCLHMSLQRQFFLLSYLKTLSSGPAGVEPATFRSAVKRSPNWANQASVIIGWWPGGGDNVNINYASFWLCIIDWSTNVFLLDIFRHKDVDLVIIRENTEGEYSHIEHEVCRIFKLFVKLLLSTCTVNSI